MVENQFEAVVLGLTGKWRVALDSRGTGENSGQVKFFGFEVAAVVALPQDVDPTDHFIDPPESQLRHVFPETLGEEHEVVDHRLGSSGEFSPQHGVLRGHSDGARI